MVKPSSKRLTFYGMQYILKLNLLKEPEKEKIIRPDEQAKTGIPESL